MAGVTSQEETASSKEMPMEGLGSEVNPLKRARQNEAADHDYSISDLGAETVVDTTGAPPKKIPDIVHGAQAPAGVGAGAGAGGGDEHSPPKEKKERSVDMDILMQDFKGILKVEMSAVHISIEEMKSAYLDSRTQISTLQEKVENNDQIVRATAEKMADISEEFHTMREEWLHMKENAGGSFHRNELKILRDQIERQEWYSRRYNLIIDGFPEPEFESPQALYQKVASFLKDQMGLTSIKFDITHRLGQKQPKMHGRVIVKFMTLSDKQTVWEARFNLKPKEEDERQQFRLIMDKPKSTKERESMAFRIVHEAQRSSKYRSAKFQYGKIWIDGEMYDQDELDRLPEDPFAHSDCFSSHTCCNRILFKT